ncbi:hypothetical protein KVT40_009327 [Elsinoe batatas]|uniref:MutL C-terminal dimerisation domain-containing protein n=1 Tax=Elsinoe batatas TaxID=2601811 RepID=A0A8K0PAY6_9PEZI|nr:hypothetical protein KVT40_009327 [Elsinoe batatas]
MSHLDIATLKPGNPPASQSQPIQALHPSVAAQIRSSAVITDVAEVVLGLLENALDADASRIDISVDFTRGGCTVQDDGCGIPPQEFQEGAGLCQLHHTSKPQSDSLHGGQGLFLAALSSIALVTLLSKHQSHFTVNEVRFHRRRCISRQTPASQAQRSFFTAHRGTLATVRDLFGDMPVRVKQRSQILSSENELARQWRSLLASVCALVTAWHSPTTVMIRDAQARIRTCLFRSSSVKHSVDHIHDPRDNVRHKVERAPYLLSSSGLIPASLASTFIPALVASSEFALRGTVSTRPVTSKVSQFISIGIEPLNPATSKLYYDAVNDIFERSSFGYDNDISDRPYSVEDMTSFRLKDLRTRRKNLDRWPVFYITIGRRSSGQSLHGIDTLDVHMLVKLLSTFAKGWLEANHFKPRKQETTHVVSTSQSENSTAGRVREILHAAGPQSLNAPRPPSSISQRSSPMASITAVRLPKATQSGRLPSSTAFRDWTRIKSGGILQSLPDSCSAEDSPHCNEQDRKHSSDEASHIHAAVQPPEPALQNDLQRTVADDDRLSEYFTATDPQTGRKISLSRRTGMTRLDRSKTSSQPPKQNIERIGKTFKHLSTASSKDWLRSVMSSWQNPQFETQVEAALPFAPAELNLDLAAHAKGHGCRHEQVGTNDTAKLQLSRSELKSARLIAQVDQKYILVLISPCAQRGTTSLVLVDQHAASERIILERLLTETFQQADTGLPADIMLEWSGSGLRATLLNRSLHFSISLEEGILAQEQKAHLARWGIIFEIRPKHQGAGKTGSTTDEPVMLVVTHLPPTISERCVLEPRLLIDMIRDECHINSNSRVRSSAPLNQDEETVEWLKHIHTMPRLFLEMLNSRACRSAVMFNDKLSMTECETLITDLAGCTFPFICAHGRVSMVPLLEIEDDGGAGQGLSGGGVALDVAVGSVDEGSDFLGAYGSWV